jgi:hypothetical protein
MPGLLSGSSINKSSPSGYAKSTQVQYQLGPSPSTGTGYTIIANSASIITYESSLGNILFNQGVAYSNLPDQNINFVGTGTGTVIVSGPQLNTSTTTGALVVTGGVGISQGLWTGEDIHVNGITIGQGYQGVNNIVITGTATAPVNNQDDGENNIAIGYNALSGITSSLNNIAIGRYALSSGTYIANSIAIGDSALQTVGAITEIYVGTVTNITIGAATLVTIPSHGLTTGTEILITGVHGTTQVNGNEYIVKPLSGNTVELYPLNDVTYSFPINSTSYSNYISSGTVYRIIANSSNIGVGPKAGQSFYEGQKNFFLGEYAAQNFTTGSYNLFVGYDVSANMTKGNNNVSLNGKNLVDGIDNQINIGAVFYYNGSGYTEINSDMGIGLGDDAIDTTSTGALNVFGGVGVSGSVYVGANLNVSQTGVVTLTPTSTGTVIIKPNTTGNLDNMIIGNQTAQSAIFTTATISSVINSTNSSTGALQVLGGVGVKENVNIGGNVLVYGELTATSVTVKSFELDQGTLNVTNATNSTSTVTGAVTVTGGVGIQGNVYSGSGNPDENWLLYSPRVTISPTPPPNPLEGQFWIDTANFAEYQWINDQGNAFWIQIAQL